MRDGALKWGLRLLGLALTIGPILIAFGMHNWDIKETVLPSQEDINQVTGQIAGVFGGGFSKDTLTFGDNVISDNNVTVPATFRSPFKVPVRVTSFSVLVMDQGVQIATLHLEGGAVEVPANGTVNFNLVGSYSGGAVTDPRLANLSVTFEIYGVTVQMNADMQGGQL